MEWRKSSYSGGTGNCVEIAWPNENITVRDSKHPTGPTLTLPTPAWQALLDVLH